MTQNLLVAVLSGMAVGLVAYPFTLRRKLETRLIVCIGLAALTCFISWPMLEFYRPTNYEETVRISMASVGIFAFVMWLLLSLVNAVINKLPGRFLPFCVSVLALGGVVYAALTWKWTTAIF